MTRKKYSVVHVSSESVCYYAAIWYTGNLVMAAVQDVFIKSYFILTLCACKSHPWCK